MKDRVIVSSLVSGAVALLSKANLSINKAWVLLLVFPAAALSVGAAFYQERDEINRSFTLRARTRVEVAAINGSVDIKAIDGDTATVQIERTARSRAEMDCNKIVLQQAAGKLIIASVNEGGCGTIQVAHRMLLTVPRYVDVIVHGVSGPINIGEIEGALHLRGNSGSINLAQSGSGSRLTGNSGSTTIKLQKLDARGIELMGNSGSVKLYVGDELNVDVSVSGLSGTVSSEVPNVRFRKIGAADYFARIGSGGPTINVDGSSGSISLIPYRE
jgi:hypothetical protein